MKQWIIYKHTAIKSSKSYIGLTSKSMQVRFEEHKSNARTGSQTKFHSALNLYGVDNWRSEIVAENIDTIHEAQALEKYYIKTHDTFENGYNSSIGGEGGPDVPPKVHEFIHFNHGIIRCTMEELVHRYSLSQGSLSLTMNGYRKHCCGWYLNDGNPPIDYFNDTIEYEFYHKDHNKVVCTPKSLSDRTGISLHYIVNLTNGTRRVRKGWIMYHNKDKKPQEGKTPNPNTFQHVSGLVFTGGVTELGRSANVCRRGLAKLLNGKKTEYKGWSLVKGN